MKPTKKACEMSIKELAAYIDHSVLKPEFTQADIRREIEKGIEYKCRTVCVNPCAMELAMEMTKDTYTKVCVVCDFPFGLSTTESKVKQAEMLASKGVFELDIVANIGYIKSGLWNEVREDLKAVVDVCHKYGTAVKVIMESDALTIEEIKKVTEVIIESGADFIKTSTGFFTGAENVGASVEVIKTIMEVNRDRCKIKGSGCIRTREHFLKLIDMGIDRMGVGFKSTPIVLGIDGI